MSLGVTPLRAAGLGQEFTPGHEPGLYSEVATRLCGVPLLSLTRVPGRAVCSYLRRMPVQLHQREVFVPLLIMLFNLTALYTHAQPTRVATDDDSIPFTDLFTVGIQHQGILKYLNLNVDSTHRDPILAARCTALYNANSYLFCNYAIAYGKQTELEKLMPDTAAIRLKFNTYLETDTAFQRLYMRSIQREMVEPLRIDSAMRIAAHFFYVHRMGKEVTVHVCIGINKVQSLSTSQAHPYHAAFCYMTIWGMDDFMTLFRKRIAPIRDELKDKKLSDERLLELEQTVYDLMANDPELRKALLDEYEQKAQYLNFELTK